MSEKKQSRLSVVARESAPYLIAILALFSFRSAIADWNDVPTGSMRPTIVEGDRIAVNRMAYDLRVPFTRVSLKRIADPLRGEIALLHSPDGGTRLVKRVIGLPGDLVAIRKGQLFVNGESQPTRWLGPDLGIEELGGREHSLEVGPASLPSRFGPVTVPAGHYFVMGDNRDESRDSRSFGPVPREAFVGRAFGVVFSRDPDAVMRFRGDRWLEPLR